MELNNKTLRFDGPAGGAHSRAFEDPTSVMAMIEERLAEGQQMTDDGSTPSVAG
jgi:hypothetical protein